MEPILVSREVASDPRKLYKELKRRGIEVGQGGRLKFFSIERVAGDADLFWVSECKGVDGSCGVHVKQSAKEPKMIN